MMYLWLILTALLCLGDALWAGAATYHVAPDGDNTRSCEAAQSPQTPRLTLNAGLACLAGGDILELASGTYPELLVTSAPNLPPGLVPIPNGTGAACTTLRAAPGATVWLKPPTSFPGGGGVLTLFDAADNLCFQGLNVDAQQIHTNGVLLRGNRITFTDAEVKGARKQGISAQSGSHYLLSHLEVHHNGNDPKLDHGLYLCGTDKIVEHVHAYANASYGVQVACETGGIRRFTVRHVRSVDHPGRGLHIQGQDHLVHDVVLLRNGIGIGANGSNMEFRHITIAGYRRLPDNYGIITNGRDLRFKNVLLLGQVAKVVGTSGTAYIYWGTGGKPDLQHVWCDVPGMGCTHTAPASALVRDLAAGDLRLRPGSPAIGAGVGGADIGALPYTADPPVPPVPDEPPPDPTPPTPPTEPPHPPALLCGLVREIVAAGVCGERGTE